MKIPHSYMKYNYTFCKRYSSLCFFLFSFAFFLSAVTCEMAPLTRLRADSLPTVKDTSSGASSLSLSASIASTWSSGINGYCFNYQGDTHRLWFHILWLKIKSTQYIWTCILFHQTGLEFGRNTGIWTNTSYWKSYLISEIWVYFPSF